MFCWIRLYSSMQNLFVQADDGVQNTLNKAARTTRHTEQTTWRFSGSLLAFLLFAWRIPRWSRDTAAIDVVAGSGNCGGLASIQMRRPVRSSFVLCCSDVALAYSLLFTGEEEQASVRASEPTTTAPPCENRVLWKQIICWHVAKIPNPGVAQCSYCCCWRYARCFPDAAAMIKAAAED